VVAVSGGAEGFASAAAADDRHVGLYGAQLAAGLIDAAGIRSGQRVWTSVAGPAR